MRLDLVCNDGSPLGVTPADIYGRGVGGAELAMLSLMETLAARGHRVRVYNDPAPPGSHSGIDFLPRSAYANREPRDVLIIFRSPNSLVRYVELERQHVIWWSTDQYTVGDFAVLAMAVEFCVTISPFHRDFLLQRYHIDPKKVGVIDLGVRLEDYNRQIERVPNRMVYCSVPDRGLQVLHACWPLIRREVQDASLVITSDYRLWGLDSPQNHHHRLAWAGQPAVQFLGRLPRLAMVAEQQRADLMAYPCTYEELFCISAAECQVAGAVPITTVVGALPTTAEHGILIPGVPTDPRWVTTYVRRIISLLTDERPYLERKREAMMTAARMRFDWSHIAERWEQLFEHGRLD